MFRFLKNHHQGVTELYFSKYVHAFNGFFKTETYVGAF
jgi:hypothetical protein